MNRVDRICLPRRGTLVVVNGPSSSGKRTLAKNVQRGLSFPVMHVQLDAFRAMEPPGYFDHVPDDLRSLRVAALCRAINAACAQHLLHGQDVVLDHALPEEGWRYLREDLAGHSVITVGVFCSLEELGRRERQRTDRPQGLAAAQFSSLHQGCRYDMEVDTTDASALECAAIVIAWLEARHAANAFGPYGNEA